MAKRVFIIHGWGGYSDEGWFPWLKRELEQKGFVVSVPAMPNSDAPVIADWIGYLAHEVDTPDADTYFVGHSIGCQTILRYLETLPVDVRVGGAVFVAGWFVLGEHETEEEKIIGKPWVQTPIDFAKVKSHTDHLTAIFSDDDDVVPVEGNKDTFEKDLGAKIVMEHGKGHFSGSDDVIELPSVLEEIVEMGG